MAERPWKILRDRPEIEFVLCRLPAGVKAIYARQGQDAAILVSRDLDPAERLAAVVHELEHHKSGGGCHFPDPPPLLRVVETKDEARVQGLVADHLVPPAQLAHFVERRAELGMVLARDVMEEFDVPADVADTALRRLAAGF